MRLGSVGLTDDDNGLSVTASEIAIHPDWSYATLSNDIAVLTFPTDIEVMTGS